MNAIPDQLLIWEGVHYALPLIGDAPVCCFRSDLLDDPSHQAAFEKQFDRKLAPPATWADFERFARFFAEMLKGPSLPPLPPDDVGLERLFYSVAAGYVRPALDLEQPVRAQTPDRFFCFDYA